MLLVGGRELVADNQNAPTTNTHHLRAGTLATLNARTSGTAAPSRPRIRPLAVVATIAGVLLFIYTLQASGPREILRQLRQIGFGFLVVLALSAIRMAVRAKAWSLCVEDTERFTFGQAFKAYVTGDAVGNVLPLGPLASEGTKALLIRRNIATSAAFSSVVLENIFYSISVAIMVMVGTLAFLLGLSADERSADDHAVARRGRHRVGRRGVVASAQPAALAEPVPQTRRRARRGRSGLPLRRRRARNASDRFCCCSSPSTSPLCWRSTSCCRLLVGHTERTLLMAMILGTVERLIMIAFKFVPLRLGVDHAGSGSIAEVLGIGSAVGVTIATVRTARNLFWAAVGLAMLARSTQKEGPAESAGPESWPEGQHHD